MESDMFQSIIPRQCALLERTCTCNILEKDQARMVILSTVATPMELAFTLRSVATSTSQIKSVSDQSCFQDMIGISQG